MPRRGVPPPETLRTVRRAARNVVDGPATAQLPEARKADHFWARRKRRSVAARVRVSIIMGATILGCLNFHGAQERYRIIKMDHHATRVVEGRVVTLRRRRVRGGVGGVSVRALGLVCRSGARNTPPAVVVARRGRKEV